ncbi:hypothetical protein [Streptomyces atratus]
MGDRVSSLESSGAPSAAAVRNAPTLQAFGTDKFNAVHAAVHETLKVHLADGGPHTRITDRREALRGIRI